MQAHKVVLVICILLLLLFYLFQKDIIGSLEFQNLSKDSIFILKKSLRFVINDLLMIGVIYGLFNKNDYVKVAFLVQVLGLILLLIPYLLIKLYIGGYNGPMVSFLHRLVLNPLLLILLIPAFYYQENLVKNER